MWEKSMFFEFKSCEKLIAIEYCIKCSVTKSTMFPVVLGRSLSSNVRSNNSITLVDTPGFQSPVSSGQGRTAGATFEDLCHNYTQERLQAFFHELTLATPQERYREVSDRISSSIVFGKLLLDS